MTHTADDVLGAAAVLRELIGPLIERLDAQEARIAALEQQPIGVLDAGVWTLGKRYEQGDGVTWDGHYWVAQEPTRTQPGDGSTPWRLAVRRGKQGREGKACRCAERMAS